MSCEHASETTLLWLYGEADDAHALHVAGCPDCQEVLREHEAVASALGPALAATASAPPASSRSRVWVGVLVALAAGLLVWLAVPEPPEPVVVAAPSADPLDVALDDLDLELDRLSSELEML